MMFLFCSDGVNRSKARLEADTVDRGAEIRRQFRRLNAATANLDEATIIAQIGRRVAVLEEELVQMLGSEKAYSIVEEIRTATRTRIIGCEAWLMMCFGSFTLIGALALLVFK
jgi:hypothetical protein